MLGLLSIAGILIGIWVLVDARTIGVEKGQLEGLLNLGPGEWCACCLVFWPVGLPLYLAKREELKRIADFEM